MREYPERLLGSVMSRSPIQLASASKAYLDMHCPFIMCRNRVVEDLRSRQFKWSNDWNVEFPLIPYLAVGH